VTYLPSVEELERELERDHILAEASTGKTRTTKTGRKQHSSRAKRRA
jgi:hypothetical protein